MKLPFHSCAGLASAAMVAAFLSGCGGPYKQPAVDVPHAVVVGTFLGGELDEEVNLYRFGYAPGIAVCKGRKGGLDCKRAVREDFEGRDLPFRALANEEITITPFAILGIDYKNDGVNATTTTQYCLADSVTLTPQAGERYHFVFAYDAEGKRCGTKWDHEGETAPPQGARSEATPTPSVE